MTQDSVEKLGSAMIQHGPLSNRIYVMKLDPEDLSGTVAHLLMLAQQHGYTKIFAKVPERAAQEFLSQGFQEEARIPCFFQGREAGLFLSRFFDQRHVTPEEDRIREILDLARQPACESSSAEFSDDGLVIRPAGAGDIPAMCEVFRQVFASYPFPITDPDYVARTMQEHVVYYTAHDGQDLVAVSSAEMDPDQLNVEMTDFATLPRARRRGIAQRLLRVMETDMRARGIRTFYTIARAISPGMNRTFAKSGYDFGGTLINNTNISGRIESMNIWYKHPDAN